MKPENKASSPFKTPENYFEAFKVSVPKDLRVMGNSASSELQDPFKTPAQYLKNFTLSLPKEALLEKFGQNIPPEQPFEHNPTGQLATRVRGSPG